jgi:hypothetical protein
MDVFNLTQNPYIGDIVAIATIIISVSALLLSLQRDRNLKRKEYADKIRDAAAAVAVKLDRWVLLALSYFDTIQPVLVEVDSTLVKDSDVLAARDSLWKGIVVAHKEAWQRILDEQVEVAYVGLYGYDPKVQSLFGAATDSLKQLDGIVYNKVLQLTQGDVLELIESEQPVINAQLGNVLRDTCNYLAKEYESMMQSVVTPFRDEMLKLIGASDGQIVRKRVALEAPNKVIPRLVAADQLRSPRPLLDGQTLACV